MRRVASVAPIGRKPPVMPFDRHITSGAMPACSQANSVPVRPKPVITSSAMRKTSWRRHERRQLGQHRRLVHQHAAGAQHQRLDDQRRDLVAAAGASSAANASSVRCSRPGAGNGRKSTSNSIGW